MAHDADEVARWPIGPPAPRLLTILTRILEVSVFVMTAIWIFNNLGGLRLSPKVMLSPKPGITMNDTSGLYNWHPLLMSLAFPVLMAEAILAYRYPVSKEIDRSQRKLLHAVLHTSAIVCIILALIAVFKSHSLKKPMPMFDLYSPHSYLGLFTAILAFLQYLVGLGGFLTTRLPSKQKAALSPVHMFLGRSTFVLGLATMAVGIQEKVSILQNNRPPRAPTKPAVFWYSSYFKIPCAIQLLLALTGIFVLYHHVAGPASARPGEGSALLEEEAQDPEQ